jgi:hypothetical protein
VCRPEWVHYTMAAECGQARGADFYALGPMAREMPPAPLKLVTNRRSKLNLPRRRSTQPRSAQCRFATARRPAQISRFQVGPVQVGARQIASTQGGLKQTGRFQVCPFWLLAQARGNPRRRIQDDIMKHAGSMPGRACSRSLAQCGSGHCTAPSTCAGGRPGWSLPRW